MRRTIAALLRARSPFASAIRCWSVDSTLHSVDRTAELHQRSVAHDLENAALDVATSGSSTSLAAGLERSQCIDLVLLHEPAVADYIGGENCGEAALDAFFGHRLHK